MKTACGAAALIVALALSTGCLAAHSDRTRQRSGPIRSVPVAADVKRDSDFDCPEEFGYYPHPNDCALYYVCVFGGALLESCTGGLMYSHELQTCDWPRNVGCDGPSAGASDDLERLNERQPARTPPPPRRTPPPPPPPRAQPNPIITSRGQPKYVHQGYEKQQQLYEEVDDLPPVEELESDRQQRVYRGQPSTIGQVQKDRDGYIGQVATAGRTLNNNIIPLSLQNSGKIGSFSIGTQADDRRPIITQAPQSYSYIKDDLLTDLDKRLLNIDDISTKTTDSTNSTLSRVKRDLIESNTTTLEVNSNNTDKISSRSSDGDDEYFDLDVESSEENTNAEDTDIDRGKRQARQYYKNRNKNAGTSWANLKPLKFIELQPYYVNPYLQSSRYTPSAIFSSTNNKYYDSTRKPVTSAGDYYSSANPYISFELENSQSQRPFRASFRDPINQALMHNPLNTINKIITKSPPISSLKNINTNSFSGLSDGFHNNGQHQTNGIAYHNIPLQDSSHLPSNVVTGRPIIMLTSPQPNKYPSNGGQHSKVKGPVEDTKQNQKFESYKPIEEDHEYDEEKSSEEEEEEEDEEDEYASKQSSRVKNNDTFKHDFPEPPYEFTNPRYTEIENPFADPNFDFDRFLAKLSDNPFIGNLQITSPKSVERNKYIISTMIPPREASTISYLMSGSPTISYNGMSTPRPFGVPRDPNNGLTQITEIPIKSTVNFLNKHKPQPLYMTQQQSHSQQQHNSGISLDSMRPKIKPPNFNDDRQLPIIHNFNKPINTFASEDNQNHSRFQPYEILSVTPRPYNVLHTTAVPMLLTSPKGQLVPQSEKLLQPEIASARPYSDTAEKTQNDYPIKHSTVKPLTTLANEQLSALQQYWNNQVTEANFYSHSTIRPSVVSELSKLENLFAQTIRPSDIKPHKIENAFNNVPFSLSTVTTSKPFPDRKPIPKPSPEMNDYYYDDEDDQYTLLPPNKPKYMPSSEIMPQRPAMAQNYKEYDDIHEEYSKDQVKGLQIKEKQTLKPINYKSDTVTKNQNDVSVVTKSSFKEANKNTPKIRVPVMVEFVGEKSTVLMRPEVYHHSNKNKTLHIKRPSFHGSSPVTLKPPKYLNDTTLRPYTVRHRLAKPTTVKVPLAQSDEAQQNRGRIRHQKVVAKVTATTSHDGNKQEIRHTKNNDKKANSLEPTESVSSVPYSPSPKPKLLYNGSQNYSPDQYDYYPIYDDDELYKDTDYVQQYNSASLRPAVQQTYRGTTQSARRPVETYSTRPVLPDDYDDALIQGQINSPAQYQSAIRHSTRGEGNELGYDIPSSARTTVYEATSISTTPSTTSTSTTTTTTTTTTPRSTTAPFSEAIPSRYTSRSSTDESPKQNSDYTPNKNSSDEPPLGIPSTPFPINNFPSIKKPFETTNDSDKPTETVLPTETTFNITSSSVTNRDSVELVQRPVPNHTNERKLSLTSGFSIRRNLNNTNNPYTLTVISRPYDFQDVSNSNIKSFSKEESNRYFYNNSDTSKNKFEKPIVHISPHKEGLIKKDDFLETVSERHTVPIYMRPTSRGKITYTPTTDFYTTQPTTETTKYLRAVLKRPVPFSFNSEHDTIDKELKINSTGRNSFSQELVNKLQNEGTKYWPKEDFIENSGIEPIVSPYETLNNLRNVYTDNEDFHLDSTSGTTTLTPVKSTTLSITTPKNFLINTKKVSSPKPFYYSYHVADDIIPGQTTEIFNGKLKNVIKAVINTLSSTPKENLDITTSVQSFHNEEEPKIVNIGFHKKKLKFINENPIRNNIKRVQILTEYPIDTFVPNDNNRLQSIEQGIELTTIPLKTTTTTTAYTDTRNDVITSDDTETTTSTTLSNLYSTDTNQINTNNKPYISDSLKSKYVGNETILEPINGEEQDKNDDYTKSETFKTLNDYVQFRPKNTSVTEIATTTSTTKATTLKVNPTKSLSFPTRPSRVNPAIKLAATNPGGGRRSYQSSSNCSSDNSLQANPKCNEIKYQRPTSTRGRGSAHYTSSVSETPQHQSAPNRGTPPTRSRPTLKPSTSIVTKAVEAIDVYAYPPRRPSSIYPQPTPDKTAAKCRKDVCLLPDCYCGGRDIPGELPMETVPQIVLLTFDDSVNDLNKGLYADLFEKGRVNPNGCPISATFYVSHEWTDYSQVQNLYAAGHEMASHTVSHSFGEQFSQKKWNREVGGQREILAAYGGVKLEDVRGMRAPFLSVGGNKMFKMLYDSNFTYDSSLPVYENRPPSWPYTLDYKLFHDCMIPPCPTKSYPGVWEVPMVMWQDLNGGRCSMGDACANPSESDGVYKMILKNFDRHYTTNRAPFGLYYHAAYFTQPHHKEGFIKFLNTINSMDDVWIVTNWQALQWVRDPTPISRINNFQPFQCNYQDRPKKCNNPKVCNLWHKSGVRYMRTCQPCPEIYPWTGKTGIKSSRIDNDIEE